MSFFKPTWWRPATALAVLALAVGVLSLAGAGTAHAGGTDGSVAVSPAAREIAVGGTGTVDVVLTPAAAGTSIWIIQIAYDPTVAQVAVDGDDNPICTPLTVPGNMAGAAGCDTKDTNSDTVPDTLVIFGGGVLNDNGTPRGFTTQQTVATYTFNAVGAVDAHTALTTTVSAFLGPNAETPTAAVSDGAIDIIASQGTPQIWGDGDCSGAVAPRDGQGDLNHFLGKTEISQTPPCPAIGATVVIDQVSYLWGDWDCSGAVAPRDGQGDLNHFLGKTEISQTPPCPLMGATVITS
jgi:hypothetical protein